MKKTLLFTTVIGLLTLGACTKEKPRKACFKLSKKTVNPGDSLYVLNCSENYNKWIWITSTPSYDSVNRHIGIQAGGPGTYLVALRVGDYDMTIANMLNVGELAIDSFKVQ